MIVSKPDVVVRAGAKGSSLASARLYCHTENMTSIPVAQKKRGRPATGEMPRIAVRLPVFTIAEIEEFAEREGVDRSEAIRLLITKGLKND